MISLSSKGIIVCIYEHEQHDILFNMDTKYPVLVGNGEHFLFHFIFQKEFSLPLAKQPYKKRRYARPELDQR